MLIIHDHFKIVMESGFKQACFTKDLPKNLLNNVKKHSNGKNEEGNALNHDVGSNRQHEGKQNDKNLMTSLDTFMVTSTLQVPRCRVCRRPLINPESIKRGIGPECAKKLSSKKANSQKPKLAETYPSMNEQSMNNMNLSDSPGTIEIQCQYCEDYCKDRQSLARHCAEKHNRNFLCPYSPCTHAAYRKSNLKQHVQRMHEKTDQFNCSECDYKAATKSDLISHVKHRHSEERPFSCPTNCGYEAKSRSKILRHLSERACWYQVSKAVQWEVMCRELAEILLEELNWKWKEQIDTPDIDGKHHIVPEIIIYDSDNNIEKIIDVKTTRFALTSKDLDIYPRKGNIVEFWVLYGSEVVLNVGNKEKQVIIKPFSSLIVELDRKLAECPKENLSNRIKNLRERLIEFRNGHAQTIRVDSLNCLSCGQGDFQSLDSYADHALSCNSNSFCPKCRRKSFSSTKEREKHVANCNGLMTCDVCHKTDFADVYRYDDHVAACGGKLTCSRCQRNDFTSRDYYNNHVKACQGHLTCSQCGRDNFPSKKHYDDHVAACGGKLVCPECHRDDFTSKRYYDDHVAACGGKLVCPECQRDNFTGERYFKDHVAACGGKLKCSECGRRDFPSKSYYKDHVAAYGGKLTCPKCQRNDFTTRTAYNRHLKKVCKVK